MQLCRGRLTIQKFIFLQTEIKIGNMILETQKYIVFQ